MVTLVDTGAWYALADQSDRHHRAAREYYETAADRQGLVTTDLVVGETFALLSSHLGRSGALAFWAGLREAQIPVLPITVQEIEAAWHVAQAFPDQSFSFVDCTTFALMERLGVRDAFAFDSHFLVYRYGAGRELSFLRHPA